MRNGPNHATPDESRYGLWRVQGTVLAHEPQEWRGEAELGRRAVAVRQSREGSYLPLPARVTDGDFASRSARDLLRLAVRPPHARRGRNVGEDLSGPNGKRPEVSGSSVRRANHDRRNWRGVLQRHLRYRGI